MRKFLVSLILSAGLNGNVQAQIFDLNTYTVTLPQLTVGSSTYRVVLHYDPDGRLSITQLAQTTPSIVGTWYAAEGSSTPGVARLAVAFTFLADGTYLLADNGNTTSSDPSGQPGIEVGTYTYNGATGAFVSPCPPINTDGQWGLSHAGQGGCTGAALTITIQGNTMKLGAGTPDELILTRVTP